MLGLYSWLGSGAGKEQNLLKLFWNVTQDGGGIFLKSGHDSKFHKIRGNWFFTYDCMPFVWYLKEIFWKLKLIVNC